jgi:hypothetical protein
MGKPYLWTIYHLQLPLPFHTDLNYSPIDGASISLFPSIYFCQRHSISQIRTVSLIRLNTKIMTAYNLGLAEVL